MFTTLVVKATFPFCDLKDVVMGREGDKRANPPSPTLLFAKSCVFITLK